ncbi:hypothetical protein AB1Y20_016990 [Prymnesium parvum]|uniref:Uncharacterized protein n=1 Tax=Prymnesium parvum TaxID=97485 RepID=A0AB34ICM3_PRYPA
MRTRRGNDARTSVREGRRGEGSTQASGDVAGVHRSAERGSLLPPRKSRPASARQRPTPAPPTLASAERKLPASGSPSCSSCNYHTRSRAAMSYATRIPPSACGAAVLPSSALFICRCASAVVLPANLPHANHLSRA